MFLKYDLLGTLIYKNKIKPEWFFLGALLIFGFVEHLAVPSIFHYSITKNFIWTLELSNAFLIAPFWWWFYVWSIYSIDELNKLRCQRQKLLNDNQRSEKA